MWFNCLCHGRIISNVNHKQLPTPKHGLEQTELRPAAEQRGKGMDFEGGECPLQRKRGPEHNTARDTRGKDEVTESFCEMTELTIKTC